MRYVTSRGEVATTYPANPNGSPAGLSSVCNSDGRVTILMPHPERTIAGTSGSWWPQDFAVTGGIGKTPWFQMRSEEHTSELQSLMRISYAVFCLKKKKNKNT